MFSFDREKVLHLYTYAPYKMRYWVYDKMVVRPGKDLLEELKAAPKELVHRNSNTDCFAEFSSLYTNFVKLNGRAPDRFLYRAFFDTHPKIKVTPEEIARWVDICKKYKFMPKGTGKAFITKGYFVVNIGIVSATLLYLYLVMARYLQEEPYFVKTVLYLLDEGIDIYIALTVASYFTASNRGHNVINMNKLYALNEQTVGCKKVNLNEQKFDLNHARNLRIATQKTLKLLSPLPTAAKIIKEKPDTRYHANPDLRFNLHGHIETSANNVRTKLRNLMAKDLKEDWVLEEVYNDD